MAAKLSQPILALNLFGSLRRETYMTASVVKTLESVFAHVEVTPLFPEDKDPVTTPEGLQAFMASNIGETVCFPSVGIAYKLVVDLLREND